MSSSLNFNPSAAATHLPSMSAYLGTLEALRKTTSRELPSPFIEKDHSATFCYSILNKEMKIIQETSLGISCSLSSLSPLTIKSLENPLSCSGMCSMGLLGSTTWLAFPCFGVSEIISNHEKKVKDLAISKFHMAWIVPSKIVANVVEIALLPLSSIVNVIAALFNYIICKPTESKLLLNITKEYWTHGISLLFKRIFFHADMRDGTLKEVITSNLRSL